MIRINTGKGFSLIEILVAFSIAAVAMSIIFQIYVKGTTAAILGKEYARAVAVAESRLAELGVSRDMNTGELSGGENEKYHWTIHIDDYEEKEPSSFEPKLILKRITIDVSWETKGKSRTVTLKTLRPVFTS